jgi:Site-specific recombinase XerC
MPKYNDQKKDKDDLKVISLEDFNKIIDRFPQSSSFHIPLQIAFNTGMRAAEVCGLTWDSLDLSKRTITVDKIIIKKKENGSLEHLKREAPRIPILILLIS